MSKKSKRKNKVKADKRLAKQHLLIKGKLYRTQGLAPWTLRSAPDFVFDRMASIPSGGLVMYLGETIKMHANQAGLVGEAYCIMFKVCYQDMIGWLGHWVYNKPSFRSHEIFRRVG